MKKASHKSAIAKKKSATSAFQQAANENIAPSRYRRKLWMVTGVAERDIPLPAPQSVRLVSAPTRKRAGRVVKIGERNG